MRSSNPPVRRRGAARRWLACALVLFCAACAPSGDGSGSSPPAGEPGGASPTAATAPDDWERFSDAARGVSFRYPRDLGTRYIHSVDWPPQPRVEAGPFACSSAGAETARAGRTEPVTVRGRTYCVTRVTEGAAGSVHTLYAYAMPAGDDVVILTFSLRAVQCANYDEPSRSECERERAEFAIDPIVDRIADTLRVEGADPSAAPSEPAASSPSDP